MDTDKCCFTINWIPNAESSEHRQRTTEDEGQKRRLCRTVDWTWPHPPPPQKPGHFLAQWLGRGEAAEKSGEYWPGKALLKDSFSLTAAFSSNWISDEAQSPFANAYENVFFQLPLPPTLSHSISGSISMLKINETDRLLTQFDAPQLWRFYKYWNHLSADRQKKHRTQDPRADPELEPKWWLTPVRRIQWNLIDSQWKKYSIINKWE